MTTADRPYFGQSDADATLPGAFVELAGQLSSAPTAIAYTATPTFDCATSNHHVLGAMTANVTAIDLSSARAGAEYTIKVLQDGTGTWTTTGWAAKFVFGALHSNVAALGAGMVTVWRFWAESTTVVRCIAKETYTA